MKSEQDTFNQPRTRELFTRAAQVIPGGIYGHASPAATIPGVSPYYARSASGCRYTDIDGREYIDYMCGYGPIVLGYRHPEIEEAAHVQRQEGDCFNHPTERMVELAEKLVSLIDFADWAVFGKNGSDMTTWALQVAREATGRKKVVHIAGAYHGIDPWCTPGHGGLIDEDREHIHTFGWNDLEAFEALLRIHRGQIAALILTPFHHPIFADCELPAPGFFEGFQEICRREGVLIILDDIRVGFRLSLHGSHTAFGLEPDIACYCKALGNGYPISAAVGRGSLRNAASRVFLTGSYWNNAVPMAAALKCLEILERDKVCEHLEKMGQHLMSGLEKLGSKYSIPIKVSGVPAVPYMRIADEENFMRMQRFCAEAAHEGVFFHPHHNWFMCAAHNEETIDETLQAADRAFEKVARTY